MRYNKPVESAAEGKQQLVNLTTKKLLKLNSGSVWERQWLGCVDSRFIYVCLLCHLKGVKSSNGKMGSDWLNHYQSCRCTILPQEWSSIRNHRFIRETKHISNISFVCVLLFFFFLLLQPIPLLHTRISFWLGLQPVEKSFWESGSFERSFGNWILLPAVGGLNNMTTHDMLFKPHTFFYICGRQRFTSFSLRLQSPCFNLCVYRLKNGSELRVSQWKSTD